jgi:hypothetical protein
MTSWGSYGYILVGRTSFLPELIVELRAYY